MSGLPSLGLSQRHVKLEEYALQAFVQFVVHIIGIAVIIACYYNLYVLDDYILALFWAVICSIPVFRIKIQVIHAMLGMLDWWWSVEYQVLSASELGSLKLRSLGCWTDDGEDEAEAEAEGLEDVREDLELPAEAMTAAELRKRLSDGEVLHAVVQCRRPPEKDSVLSIVKRGHWLGTLRPYISIGDFLCRDLPALWSLLALQVSWMLTPLRRFHHGEASSKPYFSLLVRLCVLHWTTRFLGVTVVMLVFFLAAHLYVFVVALRLLFTLLAWLTPRCLEGLAKHLQRLPDEYADVGRRCLKHLKVGVRWCWWVVRTRSSRVVHAWLATFLENSHFILSILIILVCILAACKALSWLCLSLRHEAFVIWRTLHGFLQPSPAYQVAMAKLTHLMQRAQEQAAAEGSAAGLWNFGQSLIETTPPEYQEWLQHNVPDFHLVKYVLYDIWSVEDARGDSWLQQNTSLEAFATLAMASEGSFRASMGSSQQHESKEENDACVDAIAVGASCVRVQDVEQDKPLEKQLQNTTALLRLLARGNVSAAFGLVQNAYNEVASASSLLGGGGEENRTTITMLDGALHGSTFVARLTMHGTIVLMHILTIASSMLGQAIVFLTALFYLLASRVSCLEVMGEFLMVIDPSKVIFRLSELVVRAVLFSALKMSAFHALFTWLLYSWGRVPIVVVPTVLSALVALIPVVSPVWSVSIWAAVYLWVQDDKASAAIALVLNLGVWWQVPTVIYAEIPESNPWLTGLSVVLGIGQFGVAGVVLGPLVASVPLICFNLVKFFNEKRFEAPASPPVASSTPTLLTLYQNETFLSQAAEDPTPGPGSRTVNRKRHSGPRTGGRMRAVALRQPAPPASVLVPQPEGQQHVFAALEAQRLDEASSEEGEGEPDKEAEAGLTEEMDTVMAHSGSSWGMQHECFEPDAAVRGVMEDGDEEESVDEDDIPLSDLLKKKKGREIRERVLSSPGGPLLKQLYQDNPGSSPAGPGPEGEGFKTSRKRLFLTSAVPDLPQMQPPELSRHSSHSGASTSQSQVADRGSSTAGSAPTGAAAG